MAEEQNNSNPSLPPKLDLRKLGANRPAPGAGTDTKPDASAPPAVPLPRPPANDLPRPGPTLTAPKPVPPPPDGQPVKLKPKLPPPPRPGTPPVAAGTSGASARPQPPAVPQQAPSPKRETSRIPLESAQPAPAGPKTIRIQPAPQSAPPPPVPGPDDAAQDAKRRTSRISLESALGGASEKPVDAASEAGGPKTIRLKRPAEPSLPKTTPESDDTSKDAFTKTAPIAADAGSAIPLTQKKTIRVKRPGSAGAARAAPVIRRGSGSEDDAAATGAGQQAAMAPVTAGQAADPAHWTFITFSILGMLILMSIIYMLSAQAFGPNLSLTRLSYGAEGMELPWPGRLYPR